MLIHILGSIAVVGAAVVDIMSRKDDDRKHRLRHAGVILVVTVVSVTVIWLTYISQNEQQQALLSDNLALQSKVDTLLDIQGLMQRDMARQESVMDIAGELREYIASAMSQGTSSLQKTTQLVLQDEVHQTDSSTGNHMTVLIFRSRYTRPLRDIEIHLQFNQRFLAVGEQLSGAVVYEQGTRRSYYSDSTGLRYTTGYLSAENDIIIKVVTFDSLVILKQELSP